MSPPMYRDSSSGYWGFPSSTMDWCEENYAVTSYVAEFWNTVSNVVFVVPPLLTAYHLWKHKLSELGPIVCFLLLTGKKVDCWFWIVCFPLHSSLSFTVIGRTTDDLWYMCHVVLHNRDSITKRQCQQIVDRYSHFNFSLYNSDIWFIEESSYISVELWRVGCRLVYILNIRGCLNYNGSPKLLASASFNYGFGFILWNLDNEYCYRVRDTRKSLPGLIAPVTQLHAWWHFFAGVGTFLTIVYIIHLRLTCLGVNPFLQFLHGFFPYYSQKVGRSYEETKFQQDINGNTVPSVKLKNGRSNNSVGNFARLL
ncbi:alkaline ceramidase 3-like [Clytia hemisphaerica]|uniref:alkaline ceramidase 3-like n=1 Tax=Clytia hemisphaerica TaxID=252671 RepID=UPI0034D60255